MRTCAYPTNPKAGVRNPGQTRVVSAKRTCDWYVPRGRGYKTRKTGTRDKTRDGDETFEMGEERLDAGGAPGILRVSVMAGACGRGQGIEPIAGESS